MDTVYEKGRADGLMVAADILEDMVKNLRGKSDTNDKQAIALTYAMCELREKAEALNAKIGIIGVGVYAYNKTI